MNNDYNNYNNNFNSNMPYRMNRPQKDTLSVFSFVSLSLGLLSFFMTTTIIIPFFLGSLGIIFAVLSKGSGKKMKNFALAGFTFSIISMALALFIGSFEIYAYINIDSYHKEMNEMYEQLYGISLDEYLSENVYSLFRHTEN